MGFRVEFRGQNNFTHRMKPVSELIDQTAAALAKLYSTGDEDRPENILGNSPAAANVVKALKVLLHILCPKISPANQQELQRWMNAQLKEFRDLLLPEIETAIPFRWKSASGQREKIAPETDVHNEAVRVLSLFLKELPFIREMVIDDVRAAYNGDPAALSFAEVKLAYPGLLGIAAHRLAHELYRLNVPIIPRIMNEWTHAHAGIDIHPGATIGRGFFIDHGTGVVIGETARIGKCVKIYQGVTLGAKSFPLDEHGYPVKHVQRHPTVDDGVVIYANTTILGGDTVIGHHSTIGGNVFLTKSVPPYSLVTRSGEAATVRSKENNAAGI